jgi:hypothetical protein
MTLYQLRSSTVHILDTVGVVEQPTKKLKRLFSYLLLLLLCASEEGGSGFVVSVRGCLMSTLRHGFTASVAAFLTRPAAAIVSL